MSGIDTGSTSTTSTPPSGDAGAPVETLHAEVTSAVAAVEALVDRDDLPVAGHVAAYERLHTALGEALSAGPDRV